MSSNLRIPVYLLLSRHGIFYLLFSSRPASAPGALREQIPWKTRDQREALIRARDFAIAADKSFVYAYGDMSAKPHDPRDCDPNDPISWPMSKDAHKVEKAIEIGMPDIAAAEADQVKHHKWRRRMCAPNSPEAQAAARQRELLRPPGAGTRRGRDRIQQAPVDLTLI